MEKKLGEAVVKLVEDDITLMDVDAFVFYARPELKLGTGWGNAISVRAGPVVQDELDRHGPAEIGEVVVTTAGKLKARHILHAVGPAFQEADLEDKLERTVANILDAAERLQVKRLALPPLGSGFYGVPPATSARVCLQIVARHLHDNGSGLREVFFCLPDPRDRNPFLQQLENL